MDESVILEAEDDDAGIACRVVVFCASELEFVLNLLAICREYATQKSLLHPGKLEFVLNLLAIAESTLIKKPSPSRQWHVVLFEDAVHQSLILCYK
ncbi:hypothetical protein ENH_00032260 [Eimeria necatrix]|uniref:Uncharacterized protein n=1 Tax=Eimeria necatrix TaxID=51315 RepID=U6MW25_9EIME|nr:hypothetical protein ENH_00032260 [Eimeria necatrix]CDJ67203.1 hypothetical protein ENH_00032260 [Eimeria necatrix]